MDIPAFFRKKIKREHILCVGAVFFFGLLAHMFKFVNYLPNYDSVPSYYSTENTIWLGRCFLALGCGISGFYDVPWLIALLSLVYLSVSAVCVTEILGLKSSLSRILTSGILVTFPAVINTFAFIYTADGYFFGMMLASLSIWLAVCKRGKRTLIAAIVFMGLSFGMYQAYVLFAAVLVLIYGIRRLLLEEASPKMLFHDLARPFAAGTAGAVFYVIFNWLLLRIEKVSLSDYQGIGKIGLPSPAQLADALYRAYHDYLFFLFYSEKGLTVYTALNAAAALLLVTGMIAVIVKKRMWRKKGAMLLSFVFAACIPICTYFYYFISRGILYHTIMLESIAFWYICLIMLLEYGVFAPDKEIAEKEVRGTKENQKQQNCHPKRIFGWCGLLVLLFTIYNFVVLSNTIYAGMKISYDRSLAVIDRIAGRIEELSEYQDRTVKKIAVVGVLPDSNDTIHHYPPDLSGTVPYYIMRLQRDYVILLERYADISLDGAEDERIGELLKTEQYRKMDVWPSVQSLAVIDDTVILKLSQPYYDYGISEER